MKRNHGYILYRGRRLKLKPIVDTITYLLTCGVILSIQKTKQGSGKQTVSVGPYQRAVPSHPNYRFACLMKNEESHHLYARDAAAVFVRFVGRDLAREAVRHWVSQKCEAELRYQ